MFCSKIRRDSAAHLKRKQKRKTVPFAYSTEPRRWDRDGVDNGKGVSNTRAPGKEIAKSGRNGAAAVEFFSSTRDQLAVGSFRRLRGSKTKKTTIRPESDGACVLFFSVPLPSKVPSYNITQRIAIAFMQNSPSSAPGSRVFNHIEVCAQSTRMYARVRR